jgi:DNA-directed RNA polymerase subunit RPC12/RpoP
MSPGETFIYFGCPRCTTPLKAPAKHAGRRQRCPLCQWAIRVPRESWRTDFEEYTFRDNAAPAADAKPEIAFDCPVCHTRMTAPQEQAGRQVACPDCRTPVTVPAKFAPRIHHQPAPQEAYALCQDYDPASSPAPQPQYIPLFCGRCGTLMQVTLDRIGSEVTCPDCSAVKLVEAPWLRGKRRTPTTTESYEVCEEAGQPPPESVAHQEHVGFACLCGTRLHALAAEAGQPLICPVCGRSVTVPPPRRKQPKPDPAKEIDGQYDTVAGKAVDRPPVWFVGRFSAMLDEHGRMPPDRPPPRWPLLSGVFTFPWRHGAWARWLSLAVGAMLIAAVGLFGWGLLQMGGYFAIPGMIFLLLAVCLAWCWTGVLFINLLTILSDTAAGADDVGQWPNPAAFVDWAGSTFFVFNSLALSVSAGAGLAWLLERAALPGRFALLGMPVVLFPLVLLCMLEMNSPFVPLSTAVCRSLLRNWRAWIGFYLETTLLLAASGGIAVAALLPGNPPLAIPVLAVTLVTSSMIYFRLLGRLAWCCSAR